MADYTSEEIEEAVGRVVQPSIRRPYGRLGNREIDTTFNDLQNAAAGVFLLEPSSPFYVVFLGTERLAETLESEAQLITNLIEAIENTNRHVTKIEDLSPLANAHSALVALEAASTARSRSFQSIENVPAFKRYDENLQRFLDESSKNSRKNGRIVPTPQESREALAGLVSDLQAAHDETLARVRYLTVAIEDYDSLNLPARVASEVMAKARDILLEHIEELQALTPQDRLSKIRDVTLDLLAGRAAVRGLGSLSQTTSFALIEGEGSVFADADHPATPAVLQAKPGPYPIYLSKRDVMVDLDATGSPSDLDLILPSGNWTALGVRPGDRVQITSGTQDGASYSVDVGGVDVVIGTLRCSYLAGPPQADELGVDVRVRVDSTELDFVMDGSFSFGVQAPGSFVAFKDLASEPYNIVLATNDTLLINVDGFPTTTVVFTPGVARSAQHIVNKINAAITTEPIVAERQFRVVNFIGPIGDSFANGLVPNGPDVDFVLTDGLGNPGASWISLGITVGTLIKVTDSTSQLFNEEYTVSALVGNVMTGTGGAALVLPETLKDILVGNSPNVRIRISDGAEEASLLNRTGFSFPVDPLNTALEMLGIQGGSVVRSRATSADQVASDVPLFFSSQQLGVARLNTTMAIEASFDGLGRTDPDNPTKIIAYKFRGRGSVAAGGPVGVVFSVAGADTAILAGDILVIRETTALSDQNRKGTVVSVTSTTITADMDAAILGSADILVEVGPDFVLPKPYLDFRVTESAHQDGDYSLDVNGQGYIPFEFTMEQAFAIARDLGGQPFFFHLVMGNKAVVFQSTKADLTTSVQIANLLTGRSAASQFFPSLPATDVGETTWFQLPSLPASVSVGDRLELYETVFNTPSRTFGVVSLDAAQNLLELDATIETTMAPLQVSQESPVPFARVRLGKKNNYQALQDSLTAWLKLDQNQSFWFTTLGRLINPLVTGGNPSASQVGSARSHTLALLGVLTSEGAVTAGQPAGKDLEALLELYAVSPVDAVDTLVDTFLARGSSRGLDILLQGRFSEFFGLSLEAMSHGGHLREQIRQVTRLDLPIRKTNRLRSPDREMGEGAHESINFENVFTDSEDAREDVVVPGDFAEITPPGF